MFVFAMKSDRRETLIFLLTFLLSKSDKIPEVRKVVTVIGHHGR